LKALKGQGQPFLFGIFSVALSEIDRNLLDRCLNRKPRAWEDFVDRFMGLVQHVIHHTGQARSMRLTPHDRDDLSAEVFLAVIRNDFAVLRNFRGQSSLATYLTVVARRVVVRDLLARGPGGKLSVPTHRMPQAVPDPHLSAEQKAIDREEVEHMLGGLQGNEALVVRMYHLEGKSYHEISTTVGMPENSIGPILSRARDKLRRIGVDPAVS
jgi:RNA polymerase sigma-70 factor (ECF subfamily)